MTRNIVSTSNNCNPYKGREFDFQSHHITVVKIFSSQKKLQSKKKESIAHSQKKKNDKNILEEAKTLNLLDNNFKLSVLNMIKEIK